LRRNQKVNFIRPNIFVLSILIGFLIFLSIQEVEIHIYSHAQLISENVTNDKIVILNFDDDLLNRFIQVVNTQTEYNKDGTTIAIPIIIYHRAGDDEAANYNTNIELCENEMKYLHDNNFRVITMRDLGYEENSDYLH